MSRNPQRHYDRVIQELDRKRARRLVQLHASLLGSGDALRLALQKRDRLRREIGWVK